MDIAAEELQNSGELDAQTVAAKVERIVDDADRNLTDIYHVMNLQRWNFVFSSIFTKILIPAFAAAIAQTICLLSAFPLIRSG